MTQMFPGHLKGFVSDDFRHIVDGTGQPLLMITGYHVPKRPSWADAGYRRKAWIDAVDDEGNAWFGVGSADPNAPVRMNRLSE